MKSICIALKAISMAIGLVAILAASFIAMVFSYGIVSRLLN